MGKSKSAKPYLRVVRTREGFRPATEMDLERMSLDYPIGTEYDIDLKDAKRSLPRFRLYWAILHFVHRNDRFDYANPEKINDALLIAAGVCTPERRLNGDIVMVPDSIAFRNMTEAQFRPYFDQALMLIETHWGIPITDLLREGKKLNTKIRMFNIGINYGPGEDARGADSRAESEWAEAEAA